MSQAPLKLYRVEVTRVAYAMAASEDEAVAAVRESDWNSVEAKEGKAVRATLHDAREDDWDKTEPYTTHGIPTLTIAELVDRGVVE